MILPAMLCDECSNRDCRKFYVSGEDCADYKDNRKRDYALLIKYSQKSSKVQLLEKRFRDILANSDRCLDLDRDIGIKWMKEAILIIKELKKERKEKRKCLEQ